MKRINKSHLLALTIALSIAMFIIVLPNVNSTNVGNISFVSALRNSEATINAQQIAPYITHSNVTQYPWLQTFDEMTNPENEQQRFSIDPTAPTTDNLLWVDSLCKPNEGLLQPGVIVDGVVVCGTNPSVSIYPAVTYGLDQNTGQVIWTSPYSGNYIVLDNTHMLVGTTCINPDDGAVQWLGQTLSAAIYLYVPQLHLGVGAGPVIAGAQTIEGWNFTNLSKPPTSEWISPAVESLNVGLDLIKYDNDRLFGFALPANYLCCFNATTGSLLWKEMFPTTLAHETGGAIAYGIYFVGTTSCYWAVNETNGQMIWKSTGGHNECSYMAVAYGKLYAYETRDYVFCFDAYDGHVVWKYLPQRTIPVIAGGVDSIDDNHTMNHTSFYSMAIADGMAYITTMQQSTYVALLPPHFAGILYNGTHYYVNPYNFPVAAATGQNEFVCLNANTGALVWRVGAGFPYGANTGTAASPAYVGPDMGYPMISDGNVYGIEQPGNHIGVGASYPAQDPLIRYPDSNPNPLYFLSLNNWYTGRVYCFGPGPSSLTATSSTTSVSNGGLVTVSGTLADMSPSAGGAPAANTEITLNWVDPQGKSGQIGTTYTDSNGKFSYTFNAWLKGDPAIEVSSNGAQASGGQSYLNSNTVILPLTVTPQSVVPILALAAVLVTMVVLGAMYRVRTTRKIKALEKSEKRD